MDDALLATSFTYERLLTLMPYLLVLGATIILFIFHTISYIYYKDELLKLFCTYLIAQMAYLTYTVVLYIHFKSVFGAPVAYSIAKESLEILTYYFYIRYTTSAIGFDKNKHKILTHCIKVTMALLLIYLPLQLIFFYVLEVSNTFIFIGVRLLMFGMAVIMFWQSYKIKDNKILHFIRLGAIVYFTFGLLSFTYMVNADNFKILYPYHFILIGTFLDLIIFSVAMSNRNKHQIIAIEKKVSDNELELQSVMFKQELVLQEQREENRKNIAMDLHDDIGSSLSSILINSEIAQKIMEEKPKKAFEIIRNISLESKEISNKIADFIWSLKLDTTDLRNSLKKRLLDYQQNLFDELNINFVYAIDESVLPKNMSVMRNILLIIKEAMNNIAKYAQAKNVTISIQKEGANILLEIKDDGIGFDINNVQNGNGLYNIKERSLAINGIFIVETSLHNGTNIKISMPYVHDYI